MNIDSYPYDEYIAIPHPDNRKIGSWGKYTIEAVKIYEPKPNVIPERDPIVKVHYPDCVALIRLSKAGHAK
jgi:hypothetical protein